MPDDRIETPDDESMAPGTGAAGNQSTTGVASEEVGRDASAREARRPARHPDPTRYGDWEKSGRCIDF